MLLLEFSSIMMLPPSIPSLFKAFPISLCSPLAAAPQLSDCASGQEHEQPGKKIAADQEVKAGA